MKYYFSEEKVKRLGDDMMLVCWVLAVLVNVKGKQVVIS